MAVDTNGALPVRTEADVDQRLQIKIVDKTTVTQQAIVDTDSNLHIENHGNDPAGVDRVQRMSEQGHAAVDGVYNGTTNTDPSQVGLIAHNRAATPADSDQTQRVTAVTQGTVRALDIALHDGSGADFTYANPLPVYLAEDPGLEIQDYNETATSVAVAGNDTHVYAVPVGKVLKLDQILCSCAVRAKFVIEISQDGTTYSTVATRWNSAADPQADTDLRRIVSVPAGGKVRVTRYNRDLTASAMYSTIVGVLK